MEEKSENEILNETKSDIDENTTDSNDENTTNSNDNNTTNSNDENTTNSNDENTTNSNVENTTKSDDENSANKMIEIVENLEDTDVDEIINNYYQKQKSIDNEMKEALSSSENNQDSKGVFALVARLLFVSLATYAMCYTLNLIFYLANVLITPIIIVTVAWILYYNDGLKTAQGFKISINNIIQGFTETLLGLVKTWNTIRVILVPEND